MVVEKGFATVVRMDRTGCARQGLLLGSGVHEVAEPTLRGAWAEGSRPKVLVTVAEDWFALSHFVPLLREVSAIAGDVVVATRSSGLLRDIEKLGVRARDFDFHRGSLNVSKLLQVRGGLGRLIDEERPDAVHAIAMQTMVMTGLALSLARHRPRAVILHLTGLGYLGSARSPLARLLRPVALSALRHCMRSQNAWLIAENQDDLARMIALGVAPRDRTALVPGAGVDPALFPAAPPTLNPTPRAAFVGRMLLSKGVHVLVEAHRRLRQRGIPLDLALYGAADSGSRQAIAPAILAGWSRQAGVAWHGRTDDAAGVWRTADIAVVPTLGGEGMPRAMLEAGACGRALAVSDVPGCRHFVRHGVEGLVVAPGDPEALTSALGRLATDTRLRTRLGEAARRRVLEDYTDRAVQASIRRIYGAACAAGGPSRRAAAGSAGPVAGERPATG
jgi:glycosyltransferase involved in cell wall biosynthesis